MNNLLFELYKVKREILVHGCECNLYKHEKDDYGESTGDSIHVKSFRGLFHLSKGYSHSKTSDGTETHAKGMPMILCKYEDTENMKRGMQIIVNNKRYNISDINNIQEYNIVADVSLELVIDGEHEY